MRKIFLAKHIGFCSGVNRAVNLAYDAAKKGKVYSLGPLIHNPQEVKRLEKAGVKVIKSLGNLKSGTFIIRSHGLAPKTISMVRKRGLKILDATCPLVCKVQKIAAHLKQKGYQVIIVGDYHHPEVKGIQERAGPKSKVIDQAKGLVKILPQAKVGIIAQTTQSKKNFQNVVRQFKKINKDVKIFDTICRETERRQKELIALVKKVDIVLIVGGYNSSNTRRLVELSREAKKRTYHLESRRDLTKINLTKKNKIGIMTGASTPNWIVEEIVQKLCAMPNKMTRRFEKE